MALRKFVYIDQTNGYHDEADAADSIQLGDLTVDGSGAGSGTITITGGGTITGLPASPSSGSEATSKTYVDNLVSGLTWKEPVELREMISDADQSGSDPTPSATGEAWLVNNWSTQTDGDIVEWDGAAWQVIVANSGGEPPDGTRVTVTDGTAAGSFAGEEGEIATYDATGNSWSFEDPANGWAFLVMGGGGVDENTSWVWDSTPGQWVQFSGAGQIVAGAGLDKTGNTIFVGDGDGITVSADAIAVDISGTNPGLEYGAGTSPAKPLQVKTNPNGGIQRGATGIEILLDEPPDTLALSASGLSVTGVPANFKINDVATVSATPGTGQVTAANLNTLTAGPTTNADSLHTHSLSATEAERVEATHTNNVAITAGEAVRWSGTNSQITQADNGSVAGARCIGVARVGGAASPGTSEIVKHGVAVGVLTPQTDSFTVNNTCWLGASGDIRLPANIPIPGRLIRLGFAVNADDLDVQIMDLGYRRS